MHERFEIRNTPLPQLSQSSWVIVVTAKNGIVQLGDDLKTALRKLVTEGTMKQIFASHGIDYRSPPNLN